MKLFHVSILLRIISLCQSGDNVHEETAMEGLFIQINDEKDLDKVTNELLKHEVHYFSKITSLTYIFQDSNYHTSEEAIKNSVRENEVLRSKVLRVERARKYEFELFDKKVSAFAVSYNEHPLAPNMLKCQIYFDMGVEDAWRKGFTGKGVNVVVNDVGVNMDIPDLNSSIHRDLSYNYVANTTDVTPEDCSLDYGGYYDEPDHGNRCAGVIAAERNDICGEGVSFYAKLVVVKGFGLEQSKGQCKLTHSDISIARALVHKLDKVDIYSSSWGSLINFLKISFGVSEAIKAGVEKGRNGSGAIYVFPVGKLADPYANSIYTIAVNGAGANGRVPSYSELCACTLTSAYGERSKSNSINLLTTSHMGGKCTRDFTGVSASTAIVSGILALVLEVNSKLGWREIQHIVVESSSRNNMHKEHNRFLKNGAGRWYHPNFGFGLINATTAVTQAAKMKPLPDQLHVIVKTDSFIKKYGTERDYACHKAAAVVDCSPTCITKIEHVVVKVDIYSRKEEDVELLLSSPSNTTSLLMNKGQSSTSEQTNRRHLKFLSVNYWGEISKGMWALHMKQHGQFQNKDDFGFLIHQLSIYGTGSISNPTPHLTTKANGEYANSYSKHQTTTAHTTKKPESVASTHTRQKILHVVCVLMLLLLI